MEEPEYMSRMVEWAKRVKELEAKRDLELVRLLADPKAVLRVRED